MTGAAQQPIVIVGGAGSVGTMLAGLLRADGHPVTILDPAAPPGAGPHTVRGDISTPTPAVAALLGAAGTIILAVPEPVAVAALPVVAATAGAGTLLVDTLSVKTPMARALPARWAARPAVGINPMYAPALGPAGRPVAVVRYCDRAPVETFVATVRRWGPVIEVDPDEHDRVGAATQALTHATVLAFGLALDRLAVPAAARPASTPPHTVLRALLARITSGSGPVYHDIQAANPHAAAARRALTEALTDLDSAVARGPEPFGELLGHAARALGDDTDRARQLCVDLFGVVPAAPGGKERT